MKVYVKLEGHEFRYEIENILKMFFEMGSTEISYQDPGENYRGILLYSRLDIPYGSDGLYRTETVICVDGRMY